MSDLLGRVRVRVGVVDTTEDVGSADTTEDVGAAGAAEDVGGRVRVRVPTLVESPPTPLPVSLLFCHFSISVSIPPLILFLFFLTFEVFLVRAYFLFKVFLVRAYFLFKVFLVFTYFFFKVLLVL